MSLYQTSVLNKYLASQDTALWKAAFEKYSSYFLNPEIQQNIRNSKEEQFQEGFLRELFVNILGYTINPHPGFNLTTELKNVKGAKKTDGAILKKDGSALAVIELKGTDTKDLDKVNEQAFSYKNNQPGCIYVITSNFEKLRFFIHNTVDYEEFNLFALTEKRFALLWLFLQKDNLQNGIPAKVKEESLLEEEKVTKRLYADYSAFKQELWQDMVKQNPKYDPLLLYRKSQKLLDRFLFIYFSEDKGLLPPNSISMIIEQWAHLKELDEYKPLYDRFKKYFGYMNKGFKGTKYQIHAYNGGLFKPDELLDSLVIDDELLRKHSLKLSNYNFSEEVDTNILGHIFEHSLNDIENVRAQLAGEAVDKSKTKRKKDGVYYTPKYITKYIVDNTVGKLCEEKKAEIRIDDEEFAKERKGRRKQTIKKLDDQLKQYRDWLLQLTICDPACGSGAFLNQALEFLIGEHEYVDELKAQLFESAIVFPDVENHILENNLYGVDINEESVEIARLSLWLRTAKKGRKLTSLSENIKVGNSLIDDPKVAGELAFNWKEQFPKVFDKGGFDVVIGNPPYVHLESIKKTSEQLSKLHFQTYDRRGDLYPLFVEKGMNILKQNGAISYIMPNKWLQAGYGRKLREYFLKNHLVRLIDFGDFQIFQGATTYPCIFISRKSKPSKTFSVSVLQSSSAIDFEGHIAETTEEFHVKEFSSDIWVISSNKDANILKRLKGRFKTLSQFINGEVNYGIKPGLSEAFIIDSDVRTKIISENSKASERILPFLQGRDVKPYSAAIPKNYLILFKKGQTNQLKRKNQGPEEWLKTEYGPIYKWLEHHKRKAEIRTDQGDYWWELRACDYYDSFRQPKIMYQAFQVKPCFIYDEQNFYCNNSMWIIPTESKSLVGVLNSNMGWWLIKKHCTQIQNGCQLIWKYFGQIPVPELDDATGLEKLSSKMIEATASSQAMVTSFLSLLQSKFDISKPSKKLQNWPSLDFKGFLTELKKAKVKLTLDEEAEWMAYFNKKKAEANTLQAEINRIDREIDQMVYDLYGLTDEEIKIVENG